MDFNKVKKDIELVIKECLPQPHYKVFIFGSRANGKADSRSDIDIGIDAGEEIKDGTLNMIRERLDDLPILQKFDVVDFSSVEEKFKKVALEKIDVIYEQ